ncbi:hypothetical protein AMTRI_Chr06g197360 [Amborella trichopoda]
MACLGGGPCSGDGGACGGRTQRQRSSLPPSSTGIANTKLCCKCQERDGVAKANQTESLCPPCLRSSLFAKFKLAVTSHAMISPTDKLLVAFSGGPASRSSSIVIKLFSFLSFCSDLKRLDEFLCEKRKTKGKNSGRNVMVKVPRPLFSNEFMLDAFHALVHKTIYQKYVNLLSTSYRQFTHRVQTL